MTSEPKLTQLIITVQEIPCATDILAMPGDVLLIYNGVCVGTKEAKPPHEEPATPPAAPALAPPTQQIVYDAIKSLGTATTRVVADAIGYPRNASRERSLVSLRIKALAKAKRIEPLVNGRKKHFEYRVCAGAQTP